MSMQSGYRLKECRVERGLTQQEVADALGISRVNYTRYETGARDVPLDVLIDLASFYKCTTDELLGSGYYYAVIRDAK